MKKISLDLENEVVQLLHQGYSCRQITKRKNLCSATVSRIKRRRNVSVPFLKGGRPRKLSDRDARKMYRLMHNKLTGTPILASKAINKCVSESTARGALQRIGLQARIKLKKPALFDKNIECLLKSCRKRKNWSVNNWNSVIWSENK